MRLWPLAYSLALALTYDKLVHAVLLVLSVREPDKV